MAAIGCRPSVAPLLCSQQVGSPMPSSRALGLQRKQCLDLWFLQEQGSQQLASLDCLCAVKQVWAQRLSLMELQLLHQCNAPSCLGCLACMHWLQLYCPAWPLVRHSALSLPCWLRA